MFAVLAETAIGQGVALAALMTVAWSIWRWTGNAGWIDFGWTCSVGLVGGVSAVLTIDAAPSLLLRQIVVAAFVILWSLRLAAHIGRRTLKHGDDPRYAELIRQWGMTAPRRMLEFALAQAAAGVPLVLAALLAAHKPERSITWQDVLGFMILAAGIFGASTADGQLRNFAANPENKGKICDAGLWSWSRHPNYFFEWLGWLGLAVIAIDLSGAYLWGWLAVAAPLWMYWLLVYVSGIPPLEDHMLRTRGIAFRGYQRRTNAFFPQPPRRAK